jgi:peptide/nickel transport system ATP-binding protein
MNDAAVFEVSGLRVEVARDGSEIVDGISFTAGRGEVVGLVGESGSGKTTVAVALLGHARRGTRIVAGSVRIAGTSMLDLPGDELRRARGRLVAYVPQDPAAALNPALRVGLQLEEMVAAHGGGVTRDRIAGTLAEVALPTDEAFLRRYPHQLSGGQQQRVCLAMAFLLRPAAIVLDEPTTGLDVTTQAHVLETVRELCEIHETAAVYVSHDLAVIAAIASRVVVLYAGRVVEDGPTEPLFTRPGHPYTRKLASAIPDVAQRRRLEAIPGRVPAPGLRGPGCVFAPRCDFALPECVEAPPAAVEPEPGHLVRCIRVAEIDRPSTVAALPPRPEPTPAQLLEVRSIDAFHGEHQVLHHVSLALGHGECLALVGESGSGKTTLARVIAGLHSARTGDVLLDAHPLEPAARERPIEACRRLQYVFQSPHNALNPRRSIGEILRGPLRHFHGLRGRAAEERAGELLEHVSLSPELLGRYPAELSGGERQRVAIARALAAEPDVLVCDEITSALDTSVQAAIVDLLEHLREHDGVSLLFVTHNLALVRTIADRMAVLERGTLVEYGSTANVLDGPVADYTKRLLLDTPNLTASASDLPRSPVRR